MLRFRIIRAESEMGRFQQFWGLRIHRVVSQFGVQKEDIFYKLVRQNCIKFLSDYVKAKSYFFSFQRKALQKFMLNQKIVFPSH